MTCVCERCSRLAAAMSGEPIRHADEALCDVWSLAYEVALAHEAHSIGLEHVVHAMTSLPAGHAVLLAEGVDVAELREAAGWAMAHAAADAGTEIHAHHELVLASDDDAAAALDYAVDAALARGALAGVGDLLDVLMSYEPADPMLADVFAVLQGSGVAWSFGMHGLAGEHGAGERTRDAEGLSPRTDAFPWRVGQGPIYAEASQPERSEPGWAGSADHGDLAARLMRVEQQAEDDRQRIVHALQELSRQRERLPGAEDWRSQMQRLLTQLDALRREQERFAANAAAGAAADSQKATAGATANGADLARFETTLSEMTRRVAGLAGMMERQQREIERLAQRFDRVRDGAGANERARMAVTGGEAARDPDGRHRSASASAGIGDPSHSGASLASAAAAATASSASTSRAASSSSSSSSSSASASSSSSTSSSSASRRSRRPRPAWARARARRRTSQRFARLRFTSVARLGLRRRPKRRERSWWRFLGDRDGWRQARARGGRYRTFGERFSHRGARSTRPDRDRSKVARMPREAAEHSAPDKRFYLAIEDDIVDAPSIGPKTAERLRPARIFTVRDLLDADPDEVASIVTARHITAQAVRDWQDQARLVITVPFLRGTHAQILVGAGFRTYEDVALADQATLMSAILRFATTREGQSILRNGPPPDLEKVVKWMENALESEPARAA